MEVSDLVKRAILKSFLEYIEEDRSDRLHVTDITYTCPRRAFYSKRIPELLVGKQDERSIVTLALGKKIHEIPIAPVDLSESKIDSVEDCEELRKTVEGLRRAIELEGEGGFHEIPVAYIRDGKVIVSGRADELLYIDGEWVLVDKKSTNSTPRSSYDHHILQLQIYARLLDLCYGIKVNRIAVAYIDKSDGTVTVYTLDYDHVNDTQKTDLLLEEAIWIDKLIREGGLPPARPGWWCKYCVYHALCLKDYNPAKTDNKGGGQ